MCPWGFLLPTINDRWTISGPSPPQSSAKPSSDRRPTTPCDSDRKRPQKSARTPLQASKKRGQYTPSQNSAPIRPQSLSGARSALTATPPLTESSKSRGIRGAAISCHSQALAGSTRGAPNIIDTKTASFDALTYAPLAVPDHTGETRQDANALLGHVNDKPEAFIDLSKPKPIVNAHFRFRKHLY